MNTCADDSKRALKAYFTSFWVNVSDTYNKSNNSAKLEVKSEIFKLANKIIELTNKLEN